MAPDGQDRHGALGFGEEDGDQEEDDGEHLFGDNMENDYRPMPALDRYVFHSTKSLNKFYHIYLDIFCINMHLIF